MKALIHYIKGLNFFKLQLKAVHGWNLTNLSNVCHRKFFRIAQICPCFLGPIDGQTFIMIRLGSSWYNCIYWSNSETLSDCERSSMKHMIITRLTCAKANS